VRHGSQGPAISGLRRVGGPKWAARAASGQRCQRGRSSPTAAPLGGPSPPPLPLGPPPVVLHLLAKRVALAADLDRLRLLQRGQLLAPVEHALLEALPPARGRGRGRKGEGRIERGGEPARGGHATGVLSLMEQRAAFEAEARLPTPQVGRCSASRATSRATSRANSRATPQPQPEHAPGGGLRERQQPARQGAGATPAPGPGSGAPPELGVLQLLDDVVVQLHAKRLRAGQPSRRCSQSPSSLGHSNQTQVHAQAASLAAPCATHTNTTRPARAPAAAPPHP
jgi:hypothetical protein